VLYVYIISLLPPRRAPFFCLLSCIMREERKFSSALLTKKSQRERRDACNKQREKKRRFEIEEDDDDDMPAPRFRRSRGRNERARAVLVTFLLFLAISFVAAESAQDVASGGNATNATQIEEAASTEEEEGEAEIGKREKQRSTTSYDDEKLLFFSGPAYGGCCDDPLNLLSCCAKGQSCCPASDLKMVQGEHPTGAVFLECCATKTGSVSINIGMSEVKEVIENGRCCSSSDSITGSTMNNNNSLKCCEELNGCCSKRAGTSLDCCFSDPIDEVDLTEDKEEEKKTNEEEREAGITNGNDISEEEREDVQSLVDATAYVPGGNRRFTWENLKVPMPSTLKKIIAERREKEEEDNVVDEVATTAPTGQEEDEVEETRKTFKTMLDISSFKMNKNEVLQGVLGFGIFVIVASYIVGATYTREDGREISGNARGWSGVREERENLYDSAFKAYASV